MWQLETPGCSHKISPRGKSYPGPEWQGDGFAGSRRAGGKALRKRGLRRTQEQEAAGSQGGR